MAELLAEFLANRHRYPPFKVGCTQVALLGLVADFHRRILGMCSRRASQDTLVADAALTLGTDGDEGLALVETNTHGIALQQLFEDDLTSRLQTCLDLKLTERTAFVHLFGEFVVRDNMVDLLLSNPRVTLTVCDLRRIGRKFVY